MQCQDGILFRDLGICAEQLPFVSLGPASTPLWVLGGGPL